MYLTKHILTTMEKGGGLKYQDPPHFGIKNIRERILLKELVRKGDGWVTYTVSRPWYIDPSPPPLLSFIHLLGILLFTGGGVKISGPLPHMGLKYAQAWTCRHGSLFLKVPLNRSVSSACGFGQQVSPRVQQNCCCPRTQTITVYYYVSVPVFIFKKCEIRRAQL